MGLCVKRSRTDAGSSVVDLADLGRETETAQIIADTPCRYCKEIIGVGVNFQQIDGRPVHTKCIPTLFDAGQ